MDKPTNPKDAVGIRKVPLSTVSSPVLLEIGLGMLEGARKYGRHNYRSIGVRGSVYYDATQRHLMEWWEGRDIDGPSGLHNVTKALASLVVLRDAMIVGKFIDDRPPALPDGWLEEMNRKAGAIIDSIPEPKEPYTELTEALKRDPATA